MTSKPEIREAPVPVRYGWSLYGVGPHLWFDDDECRPMGICACVEQGVDQDWSAHVELSDGSKVIVRAKRGPA